MSARFRGRWSLKQHLLRTNPEKAQRFRTEKWGHKLCLGSRKGKGTITKDTRWQERNSPGESAGWEGSRWWEEISYLHSLWYGEGSLKGEQDADRKSRQALLSGGLGAGVEAEMRGLSLQIPGSEKYQRVQVSKILFPLWVICFQTWYRNEKDDKHI